MLKKRIVSAALAMSLVYSSTALNASALSPMTIDLPSQGTAHQAVGRIKCGSKFSYRVNPDGKTVSLIEFTDKAIESNTLRIPSKLDGMNVTVMARSLVTVFNTYYKKIKVLDIPKNVKTIEECLEAYFIDENDQFRYYSDLFTIKCCKKTAAETFAAQNNFKYSVKDADKNYVHAVRFSKSVAISSSKVKIKWSKVKNASGYRLYRMENYKWKKVKDLAPDVTSYKDADCGRNGYNYYMIRVFRKSGGKTYWSRKSTIKGVKCFDSTAPKVKNAAANGKDGFDFTASNYARDSLINLYVDVQDPESGEWCRPRTFYNSTPDAEVSGTVSDMSFDIDGKRYSDEFIKGRTYKVRFRYGVSVDDIVIPYENGLLACKDHVYYGKATTKNVTF